MSMIAIKPPGYFGDAGAEQRLVRFLRYGGEDALTLPGTLVDWTLGAGEGPGEVTIVIRTIPAAGDAAYWGDGAGTITATQARFDQGPPVTLGSTLAATHTFLRPERGRMIEVELRAVGSAGAGPWSDAQAVLVPGSADGFVFAVGVFFEGVFA